MELYPALRIGWFNGWLLLAAFYLGYLVLLRIFPEAVRRRLYDRSGWTPTQRVLSAIGLPFALAGLVLVIFTPLAIGRPIFYLGSILYILGFAGFIIALFNFANTPLDEPVTGGLYRLSRNPQWVMFALALVGSSIAVGSLSAAVLFGVRIVFNHFRILGEEKTCLEKYGDAYQAYLQRTPRYFLFF